MYTAFNIYRQVGISVRDEVLQTTRHLPPYPKIQDLVYRLSQKGR
jgi:hypothetical protein